MIELLVEGQAVDIAPKTKITLNFKSNIFGDISKIQPSNSFTITLPKTPTNRSIFGAPMKSNAPYRRWGAELLVNGVAIVDTAYLELLSVGENYEVALYWGVVTELQALKDSDKTLRDINEVLSIVYGGDNWWNSYKNGTDSEGVFTYNLRERRCNCGIGNLRDNEEWRTKYADLPFANVGWIWSRIIADNALRVTTPDMFVTEMGKMGMPFPTRNVNVESLIYSTNFKQGNILTAKGDKTSGDEMTFYQVETAPPKNNAFEMVNDDVQLKIIGNTYYRSATVYKALSDHTCEIRASVSISDALYGKKQPTAIITHYIAENDIWEEIASGVVDVKAKIDVKYGDKIALIAEVYNYKYGQKVDSATISFTVTEGEADAPFGTIINTADNLPTIKQIDFIKAMCQMFGLWVTLIGDTLHFQSYDDLYTAEAIDWSHKLIGTTDADAAKSEFKLQDYAQNNVLSYKDDSTSDVDASGELVVENTTLEREKEMVTLPFAATEDNIIPWYKWRDEYADELEIDEQKIEPRIVYMDTKVGEVDIRFSGLSFAELLRKYYNGLQRIIRKPIVIEEKFNLSEIDIKNLDYRRPIYLQKYGAKFAIDKVQWSENDASIVTLVMLPPKEQIQAALPYKVTTGVTMGIDVGITQVPTPIPSAAKYVTGAGEYWGENATVELIENTEYGFVRWTDEAGTTISYDNPYTYDGSRGDIVLYANCTDKIIIG